MDNYLACFSAKNSVGRSGIEAGAAQLNLYHLVILPAQRVLARRASIVEIVDKRLRLGTAGLVTVKSDFRSRASNPVSRARIEAGFFQAHLYVAYVIRGQTAGRRYCYFWCFYGCGHG